jgi:NAD(P)-dependent dehydrogenase (short-subunit alcohol dehydrogenase family)
MLQDKVVLVTGAGGGIGREVALLAAAEGAKVVVNDLGAAVDGEGADTSPARTVVKEIEAAGGQAVADGHSVSDWDGAHAMVAAALDSFGRLDAVVNVAGILRDKMLHKMDEADWDAVIGVHLKGAFNMSRAAIGHFREQQSGSFVHFTSTSGLIGNLGQANYAAAKMGVVGLSKVIAMEGARVGVRSNCVSPFAWTRMIGTIPIKDEAQRARVERLRTHTRAGQIAPMVVFLASDAAAKVSGQVFAVRGNEVFLMGQSRPLRSLHRSEGWSAASLAEHMLPALEGDFYPLEASAQVFNWEPV